jgi:hypothetical protein
MAGGSSRVEEALLEARCTFLAGTFRHVQGVLFYVCQEIALHGYVPYGPALQDF